MNKFRFVILLFILCTCFSYASTIIACELDLSKIKTSGKLVLKIKSNINKDCYGGSADQTQWVVDARKKLASIKTFKLDSVQPIVNQTITDVHKQLISESPAAVANYDKLKTNLSAIVSLIPVTFVKQPEVGLRMNDWQYDQSKSAINIGNDEKVEFGSPLKEKCVEESSSWDEACTSTINQTLNLLRYHGAMSGIVLAYNKVNGFEELRELELLDKQWEAYFYQARPQNILEVGFNSWRFSENTKNEDGFLQPPSYQWIIAHPNIAMEYIDNAPDGERFQESLILEVIGINDWEWKGTKMEGPWGASVPLGMSVVASITDRSSIDEMEWGVIFHVNHVYSFGATFRDDHEGYFMSIDLLKFFGDWTEEQKVKFTSIKKDLEAKEAEFNRIKQQIEAKKVEIESGVEEIKEKFAAKKEKLKEAVE